MKWYFWLLFACGWFAAFYGWAANLVKLFYMINDPVNGMMIMRAIGVFAAPIGIILGYI